MAPMDKPLVWLRGEVKTPPFSPAARLEAGLLLPRLQRGEKLDPEVIVIVEVFPRKTPQTPDAIVARCRQRLRRDDRLFTDLEDQ